MGSSRGFQTYNHRHLRICFGEIWWRKIFATVPVCSQLFTSLFFAFSNSCRSAGSRVLSLTSVLCLFVVVARKRKASSRFWFWLCMAFVSCSGLISSSVRQKRSCPSGPISVSTSWHIRRSQTSSSAVSSGIGISWGCLVSSSGMVVSFSVSLGVSAFSGSWSGWSAELWLGVLWGGLLVSLGIIPLGLVGTGLLFVMGLLLGLLLSGMIGSVAFLSMVGISRCSLLGSLSPAIWSRGIRRASTALTGLTCSGAALRMDPILLQNTALEPSCWMTFAGPYQDPWLETTFHTMTHSPASYEPLCGLSRRKAALRRDMSLSAEWKARRAVSRRANISRKRKPSDVSSHALACVGSSSSPVSEPGILALFPNTSISGEYPCRIPHVFFAVVHCANACCNCE